MGIFDNSAALVGLKIIWNGCISGERFSGAEVAKEVPTSTEWDLQWEVGLGRSPLDEPALNESKTFGEKFLNAKNPVGTGDVEFGIGGEFEQPLAAGAAGHATGEAEFGFGIDAGHGHGMDLFETAGNRSGECRAFGAQTQSIAGILDVAADDNRFISVQGGSDAKPGIRGMGVEGSLRCGLKQSVAS